MKLIKFSLFAALLTACAPSANAGTEAHGGDICENRFKIVREDLRHWLLQGGASGLRLPYPLTQSIYEQTMQREIDAASITCVSDPVIVGGAEKTCMNWHDGQSHIVCNANRFLGNREEDQYVLVHHEYAGLAGFETGQGSDSNYDVSNQLTAFLADQVVKKLVVAPAPAPWPPNEVFEPTFCMNPDSREFNAYDAARILRPGVQTARTGQYYGAARYRTCSDVAGCSAWVQKDLQLVFRGLEPSRQQVSFRFDVANAQGALVLATLGEPPLYRAQLDFQGLVYDGFSRDPHTDSILRFRFQVGANSRVSSPSHGYWERDYNDRWNYRLYSFGEFLIGTNDDPYRMKLEPGRQIWEQRLMNNCGWIKTSTTRSSTGAGFREEAEIVFFGRH